MSQLGLEFIRRGLDAVDARGLALLQDNVLLFEDYIDLSEPYDHGVELLLDPVLRDPRNNESDSIFRVIAWAIERCSATMSNYLSSRIMQIMRFFAIWAPYHLALSHLLKLYKLAAPDQHISLSASHLFGLTFDSTEDSPGAKKTSQHLLKLSIHLREALLNATPISVVLRSSRRLREESSWFYPSRATLLVQVESACPKLPLEQHNWSENTLERVFHCATQLALVLPSIERSLVSDKCQTCGREEWAPSLRLIEPW